MFDSGISAQSLITEVKSEVDVALPISDETYVMWLNTLEQFLYSSIIREQNKVTAPTPYTGTVRLSALPVASDEAPIRFEDIYTVYADTEQLIKTNAASGTVFGGCYWKYNNDMAYSTAKTPDKIDIVYFVKPTLKQLNPDCIDLGTYNVFEGNFENYKYTEGDLEAGSLFLFKVNSDTDGIMFLVGERGIIVNGKLKEGEQYVGKVLYMPNKGNIGFDGQAELVQWVQETVKIPIEFIELVKSKLRAEAYMIENEYVPAANWMNNYNVLLENFKQWLNEREATFGM